MSAHPAHADHDADHDPGASAATVSPATARPAADLVACGSLEMGVDTPDDVGRIATLLPAGTPVYVNHLPSRNLSAALETLVALREANLEPVPHIAARRIFSAAEAQDFLRKAVRRAGVTKAMVIAGDVPEPLGPYADSAALLAEDYFAGSGLTQVGLAGYPEGHPRIPTAILNQALERKLELAASRGLGAHLVTQFSFAPSRIVEYCTDMARRAPGIPVYVGLAGPSNPMTLLRFAQRCGVSASLRALQAQGIKAARLVTHVDPTDQLMALAGRLRSGGVRNVVGVHIYSFGGAGAAARWMNARITGNA